MAEINEFFSIYRLCFTMNYSTPASFTVVARNILEARRKMLTAWRTHDFASKDDKSKTVQGDIGPYVRCTVDELAEAEEKGTGMGTFECQVQDGDKTSHKKKMAKFKTITEVLQNGWIQRMPKKALLTIHLDG